MFPHCPFSYHHFFSSFCNSPFSLNPSTASVIWSLKTRSKTVQAVTLEVLYSIYKTWYKIGTLIPICISDQKDFRWCWFNVATTLCAQWERYTVYAKPKHILCFHISSILSGYCKGMTIPQSLLPGLTRLLTLCGARQQWPPFFHSRLCKTDTDSAYRENREGCRPYAASALWWSQ